MAWQAGWSKTSEVEGGRWCGDGTGREGRVGGKFGEHKGHAGREIDWGVDGYESTCAGLRSSGAWELQMESSSSRKNSEGGREWSSGPRQTARLAALGIKRLGGQGRVQRRLWGRSLRPAV